MMKWDNVIFRLFIFWYCCGLILVGFDLLPSFLNWANAFFLILCGILGTFYFVRTFGALRGLSTASFIFAFSMIAEGLGVHYGLIFGKYDYSGDFGFKLADVPIGIGFAWIMVIAVTHVLSLQMTEKLNHGIIRWIVYSLLGSLIAVLIDLIIDPVAYLVKGYWGWDGNGVYYNVPFQNFTGWFWVSLFFHALLYPLYMRNKVPNRTSFIKWKHRMAMLFGMVMGMFIFLALLDGLWLAVFVTSIPTLLLLITYKKKAKQNGRATAGEVTV
ncbi:carotenoid biosynthesis protein [Anaerobacillus sp. 1_MG-2023]|uniref:carotenoid biosynthesis protein n=1 Tax=Anaerobacillus sp. 1_MG-2023 TaxID=3062655 RepID=UPI0026E2E6D3|nr:carotenoid biosynthesis protein [Anaerobacillus sp. 1_MG-2023]MDO6655840.1 carotenoid biosynthesis protein [Anaerobacillus sp. 1_MG-2023]